VDESMTDLIEEEKRMMDDKTENGKYAFLVIKHQYY
jgi:hypothetical protein